MELLSGLLDERETDAVAPVLGACRLRARSVAPTRAFFCSLVSPEPQGDHSVAHAFAGGEVVW